MKMIYLLLSLLTINSFSQIKIGASTPVSSSGVVLELESPNRSLLLTRVNNISAIASPEEGMIVYDKNNNALAFYTNNKWEYHYESIGSEINIFKLINSGIKDKYYGDTKHDFVYMSVVGEDGKVWLNNNLGSNYANVHHPNFNPNKQAQSSTDCHAYGSLYQWGRKSDGHEIINWVNSSTGIYSNGVITITSTTSDEPNHSSFIRNNSGTRDWRIKNNDLWLLESSKNNPCPSGYKVPSRVELLNYINLAGVTNDVTAHSKLLKLTLAGQLNLAGVLSLVGTEGFYATSTPSKNSTTTVYDGDYASILNISNSSINFPTEHVQRSRGYSVRCLKN